MYTDKSRADVLRWRKAKRSTGNGACVEVAHDGGLIAVRDSKNPDGAVLRYPASVWRAFLDDAKIRNSGRFR